MLRKKHKDLGTEDLSPLINSSGLSENEEEQSWNLGSRHYGKEIVLNNYEVQKKHCVLAERVSVSVQGEMTFSEAHTHESDCKVPMYLHLMEVSLEKIFPELPTCDIVNQLKDNLLKMRNVQEEHPSSAPQFKEAQLLKNLIACHHQCIFECLDQILQHVNTTKTIFTLLDWVQHKYLSTELLGHPELWDEALQAVDLRLLTDWISQAEKKLLAIVQKDLFTSLRRILQNESSREVCVSVDEAFIRLHVDVIQCLNAVLQRAKETSQTLKHNIQKLCWEGLQDFVEKYVNFEKKNLKEETQLGTSNRMYLFKISKSCNELKRYALSIAADHKGLDTGNIISALNELEGIALQHLMERPIHLAQIIVAKYFKGDDKEMLHLNDIEQLLNDLPKDQDLQKTIVSKAYHQIVVLYFQHLVQIKYMKLVKRWTDVGERVAHDAEFLHSFFSVLNPSVEKWNLILLKVREVLECSDIESLKITVGVILQDCSSTGTKHLHALLCWNGVLSRQEIKEVLEANQDVNPCYLSQIMHTPWYSCLLCC
ncbi:hypothetical protein UPYG_G00221580 [Umbra pygmaea]|uniref:Uncharacterized protein n=1 Tax=Umbra pygmaea TaxID=75934 RepID=A0ABD0WBJ3_UMBPY